MSAASDANVPLSFTLRDRFMRVAAEGCYQIEWSDQIPDEATRNWSRPESCQVQRPIGRSQDTRRWQPPVGPLCCRSTLRREHRTNSMQCDEKRISRQHWRQE